MLLANVSHNQAQGAHYSYQSSTVESASFSASLVDGNLSVTMDRVSLHSESASALTYSSNMQVEGKDAGRFEMLRSLVANLLKEQGIDTQVMIGEATIDLTEITQQEAQELVADDGYFGVEQTSERIFQFAVGIAGGDPSRLEAIKQGVDQGFQEALDAFGGWLPDISYDTYDAVMEKLDKWAQQETKAAA